MNRVYLLGNLGQDPELRHTQSGTAVLNLRLATTERYKDNDGQWQDKTQWHDVVVWGNRAEALSKFLRKGSKILVEGSLQTRKWEDRNGNDRYQTEVNAKEIELCDRREQGSHNQPPQGYGQPGPRQGYQQQQGRQPPPQQPDAFGPDDDDIPF